MIRKYLVSLLLVVILVLCTGWFSPIDVQVNLTDINHLAIGDTTNEVRTLYSPISVFGTCFTLPDFVGKYIIEKFVDTDGDGFPTVADGSSWEAIKEIDGQWSPTAGILFRYDVLDGFIPGTNYILRINAQNSLGMWSSNTNQLYWSSFAEAAGTQYGYHYDSWFRFKAGADIWRTGTVRRARVEYPGTLASISLYPVVDESQWSVVIEGGVAYVTAYNGPSGGTPGSNPASIDIPERLSGKNVVGIRTGAFSSNCSSIVYMSVGQNMVDIEPGAFTGCTSLRGVGIGYGAIPAFALGTNSAYSNYPQGTDNLSYFLSGWRRYTVYDLTSKTLVYYPTDILPSYLETSPTTARLLDFAGITYFISETNWITRYVQTNTAPYSFDGTKHLSAVIFNSNLTAMADNAFSSVSDLYGVYFTGNAPVAGTNVFPGCTNMVYYRAGATGWDTNFGGRPTAVWDESTGATNGLAYAIIVNQAWITNYSGPSVVSVPPTILGYPVTAVGSFYSARATIASVDFSSNLVALGLGGFVSQAAFVDCTSLTNVTFTGGGPITLGTYAFANTALRQIVWPSNAHTIGNGAFNNCTSLTNVVLPEGLLSIGDNAFQGAYNLPQIVIPSTVTNVGAYAFGNQPSWPQKLTKVYFEGNVPVGAYNIMYAGIPMAQSWFTGQTNLTVYFHSGTTGWPAPPATFGGRPTAYW